MTIDIPEDIATRLKQLAAQNDADINDLLRDMLARYEADCETGDKRRATLADLARHAKAAGMASGQPTDTSARSREILNTEYTEYLYERRVKGSAAHSVENNAQIQFAHRVSPTFLCDLGAFVPL